MSHTADIDAYLKSLETMQELPYFLSRLVILPLSFFSDWLRFVKKMNESIRDVYRLESVMHVLIENSLDEIVLEIFL